MGKLDKTPKIIGYCAYCNEPIYDTKDNNYFVSNDDKIFHESCIDDWLWENQDK